MAYDSPKAIHFIAYENDKLIEGLNQAGLIARWSVVEQLEGVNMLSPSKDDRKRIDEVLKAQNKRFAKIGIRVELASKGK